ncbi:MAG: hypothetical protein J6P02_00695 [Lachnospiraceae bacterium]|nr:hypothetical protein [Lachnospiraceae bacterium]
MCKKALCLIFAFLFSIESFAAVVSDNDGSAFITKAEFDSLKNNFQAQLDAYNTSIDSKIDSAIASYLAGIKTQKTESFNPFVMVNDSTPKILGRASNYGAVNAQFFNEISAVVSDFGCSGGNIQNYTPLTVAGNDQTTWWQFWVQPLSHLFTGFKTGFEFDEKGNVTSIYDDDNIVINLVITDATDPWGDVRDIGSWFLRTGFEIPATNSNRQINKQYINNLSPRNYRLHRNYTTLYATVKAYYYNYLASDDGVGAAFAVDTVAGTWANLFNSFYASHKQEDRETDISMYNVCDATIYAYPENSKYLETLYDISGGNNKTEKSMQLFTYTGDDDSVLGSTVMGKSAWDHYTSPRNHRHIYSFPKLKIANRTTWTDFKPNKKDSNAGGNQFNTLDQFTNGYMKYKVRGVEKSPKFYGGIPLFCFDKDAEKVTFDIKLENTTSGKTKFRAYFKTYEFPNAIFDTGTTAWQATNPQSGVPYSSEVVTVTSKSNPNNTGLGINIDSNTVETITIKDVKANTPYFLRFQEINDAGTSISYGGKVTLLNNFMKTNKE